MTDSLSLDESRSTRSLRLETPEGVPIRFELSTVGDRIYAFVLDVILILVVAAALLISSLLLSSVPYTDALFLLAISGWFFGYFPLCEMLMRGRTIGKRVAKLRVIDLGGRHLMAQQIFARNLTRNIELTIPLSILSSNSITQGWQLFSMLWLAILVLLPLFNRNRQRLGDFIAQTVVVRAPKLKLERDLTDANRPRKDSEEVQSSYQYTFTKKELNLYGIYELQTLEKVLRAKEVSHETLKTLRKTIWRKMSRSAPPRNLNDRRFLLDLYSQLRAELEHRLLFGERREKKQRGRLGDDRK